MKMKYLDVPLNIKSVDESGRFSGYGSVFDVKDSYSDIVVKGAFEKSLQSGRMPALLWQHKDDEPIGVYTKANEDDTGLYLEGSLLVDDDALAKRAYAHLKAGSLSGLSIGYRVIDEEYDKERNAWLLKEIDLWEVSLVTFPANDSARVADVKRALDGGEVPPPKSVERLLREAGFSRQQAKAFMSKGYGAISQCDAGVSAECVDEMKKLVQILGK